MPPNCGGMYRNNRPNYWFLDTGFLFFSLRLCVNGFFNAAPASVLKNNSASLVVRGEKTE